MSETIRSLRKQLAKAEENLRLIQERKAEYVQGVDIPLQLIKDERRLEIEIANLRERLARVTELPCPYRGLLAFREEDAPLFFGRKAFAKRLVEAVEQHALVAVMVGPSGSGKSSVVFAGLLPRLRQAGDSWAVAQFRPGSHPFDELAEALLPLLELELSETDRLVEKRKLAEALDQGDVLLSDVVERILEKRSDAGRLLLVVDQFEELYTLCPELGGNRCFLDVLLAAIANQAGRHRPALTLLLTLRADFMGQALAYRPFADALDEARKLMLGPMNQEELKAAIMCPAERHGVAFEEGLVTRILDDVGGEPGNLPLLEFALTQLWERQEGGRLTHTAYEAIGKVEGALAHYADEVYARLKEAEQEQARRVFVQLVSPGEGTEDTRRRATRTELGDADWELVPRLADARLVVSDRDAAGQEVAEVAHEALIRGWGRLRVWMDEDRTFRVWQERLRAALRQWETSEQDVGALLRGVPLAEAEQWLAEREHNLNPDERAYIRESVSLRKREQAAQARRRWLLTLASMAATVILLFLWWRSEGQRRTAVARQLAAQAEVERNDPHGSWTLASLLAVESMRRLPSLEASITLNRLLAGFAQPVVRMEHERDVNAIALSPDGRWVASGSADGTARVWQVRTGQEVACVEHSGSVNTVAFSADGRWVVSGSGECEQTSPDEVVCSPGEVRVWEAATGEQVAWLVHEEPVYDVAFSPDGQWVASGSGVFASYPGKVVILPGEVRVWQATTGEELTRIEHEGPVYDVAFSPDGQWVASGSGVFTQDDVGSVVSSSGRVRIWETVTGEEVARMAHEDVVRAVAFSPSDRLLASGSDDHTVRVWEAATGEELAELEHDGRVFAVAFSADGQWIISGADDLKARVWEVATGQELAVMRGHGGTVVEVAMSRNGRWVLTGSNDHTARVWDVDTEEEVARLEHEGQVTSVAFARGEQWVVSGGRDGTVRVWNVATMLNEKRVMGREVTRVAHRGRMSVLAISPDSQRATSGGDDGAVWTWDIGTVPETRLAIGREMGRMESGVEVVAYSSGGSWLVSGDKEGTLQAWEAATGRAVGRAKLGWEATAVAFSPDEQWAASGGGDGKVVVWEITTGNEIAKMNHGWEVNTLAFTPDGEQVVSASRNGTVLFWDVATAREVRRMVYPSPWTAVALSADGRWVASGWHDGTVQVWEAATGQEVARMKHEREVLALAFSVDERWVISSSYDGTARVWEVVSGQEVYRVEHTGWADKATFSPDGRWIVTVSYDTAWIWWWKPEDLIVEICGNLSRNLTIEQWQHYIGDEPYRPTCPNLPVWEE